jgi:hypothetical protein
MLKNVYSIFRMSESLAGRHPQCIAPADIAIDSQLPLLSGSLIYLAQEPSPLLPRPRQHRHLQAPHPRLRPPP